MSKIKVIILLIVFGLSGYAQERKIVKADKLYTSYAYIDALEIYERVANKGFISAEILQKLGDSYYFNGRLNDANKWYELLLGLKEKVEPEYYFRYSQTLKSLQQYDKANEMMATFANIAKNETRSNLYLNEADYLKQIKAHSGRYKIKSVKINSAFSDFAPSFSNDKIVFSSNRATSGFIKRVDKWTGKPFSNLYLAKLDSANMIDFGNVERFSKKNKRKFHESTAVFTKDGKTMYFTSNDQKLSQENKNTSLLLKIYRADLIKNEWSNITELPFNGQNFSCAHPALSQDEKTLYFSSDRKGGSGLSDIYRVTILSNGRYGVVENLGKKVNTEGRETFPFISESGELYFASDGHPGLGGLDIFVSPEYNGNYSRVYNLGEPINSALDDFSFVIKETKRKGFFCSNREGGQGYDDIYALEETKKMEYLTEQVLIGTFKDEVTNELVSDVDVLLYDSNFKLIGKTKTDREGKYKFDVAVGQQYYVRIQNDQYITREVSVVIKDIAGGTILPVESEKKIIGIGIGSDLSKILKIRHIYFNFDKIDINRDAAADLQKIIEVMKIYPKIGIDIRSHTDSRGSKTYNLKLSDERVQSTINYLTKSGINKDRLTGKGYGESQLINNCSDGVKCSSAEHQRNRRSEFIITSM